MQLAGGLAQSSVDQAQQQRQPADLAALFQRCNCISWIQPHTTVMAGMGAAHAGLRVPQLLPGWVPRALLGAPEHRNHVDVFAISECGQPWQAVAQLCTTAAARAW